MILEVEHIHIKEVREVIEESKVSSDEDFNKMIEELLKLKERVAHCQAEVMFDHAMDHYNQMKELKSNFIL